MADENVYLYDVDDDGVYLSQIIQSGFSDPVGFGAAVALSDKNLLIGIPRNNVDSRTRSGSVNLYTKDMMQSSSSTSSGYIPSTQFFSKQILSASTPNANELFGGSVAINQHSIAVGTNCPEGNEYYFKIPALVEDIEFCFWTKDLNRFNNSAISGIDVYNLASAVDFSTITWNTMGAITIGDRIGSSKFAAITTNQYSATGLNILKINESYDKQRFIEMASHAINYFGFLVEISKIDEIQEKSELYSNEEFKYPEYSPEMNILMSFHPSPDD